MNLLRARCGASIASLTLVFLSTSFAALFASALYAQESMFEDSDIQASVKNGNVNGAQFSFKRQFKGTELSEDSYYLDLPYKRVLLSRVQAPAQAQASSRAATHTDDIFYFDGSQGFIYIERMGTPAASALIHDVEAERAFKGLMVNGVMEFVEQDMDEVICVNYALAPDEPQIALANPDFVADAANVTEATVRSLESRPGASRVIYIDYWGGTLTGTAWNGSNNTPIVYEPYNIEGSSATFTQLELERMYVAWAEAAEDYAPFDINVTTDVSKFNAAQASRRSRIIATPTTTVAPGSGGVAYLDVFGQNSDFFTVGWTFNSGFGSMGMTHSHESGHQMGLRHDGINSTTYYPGHNNTGPIMGGPFGKDIVQWGKGEYVNANETEDDLAIISGKLPVVADDVGDTKSTAAPLDINDSTITGLIRPQGLGKDTDVYILQQGVTSNVNITVRPATEGLATGTGANLSMRAVLTDSSDIVIAQIAPTNNPATNVLTVDQTLAPGTYYLTIDNESPNTNPTTGFTEYGNGGYYEIAVNGGFSVPNPDLSVNSLDLTPSSVEPDSDKQATITAVVRNTGFTASSSYNITFYQSDDATISSADTGLEVRTVTAGLASAQTSSGLSHSFQVPQEKGAYYYGVCINGSSPSESNTGNNCSLSKKLLVEDSQLCVPIKTKNGKMAMVCL